MGLQIEHIENFCNMSLQNVCAEKSQVFGVKTDVQVTAINELIFWSAHGDSCQIIFYDKGFFLAISERQSESEQ